MEGYLWKKGALFKSWKRRYFLVKNRTVEYYTDFRKIKLVGLINVDGAEVVELPASVRDIEKRGGALFGLTPVGSQRTYLLEASEEKERQSWISLLVDRGAALTPYREAPAPLKPTLMQKLKSGRAAKSPSGGETSLQQQLSSKSRVSLKEGSLYMFVDKPAKPWKFRFAILFHDRLEIYHDAQSQVAIETIHLRKLGLLVASADYAHPRFCFTVSSDDPRNPILEKRFATETIEEKDAWIEALVAIQMEHYTSLHATRQKESHFLDILQSKSIFCRELYALFRTMVETCPGNMLCSDLMSASEAQLNKDQESWSGFSEWAVRALLSLLLSHPNDRCECGENGNGHCRFMCYRAFLHGKGNDVVQRGWYRVAAKQPRVEEDKNKDKEFVTNLIRLMWLLVEKQGNGDDKTCSVQLSVNQPGWGVFLHSWSVITDPTESYVMYSLRLKLGNETRYFERRYSELLIFVEGIRACPTFKDILFRLPNLVPKKTLSLHSVTPTVTAQRKRAFVAFFNALSSVYVWPTTLSSPYFCNYFGIDRNAGFIPLSVSSSPRCQFKRVLAYGAINSMPSEAAATVLFQLMMGKAPTLPGDPNPTLEELSTLCMAGSLPSSLFVELLPLTLHVAARGGAAVKVALMENLHLLLVARRDYAKVLLEVPQWVQRLAPFLSPKYRSASYAPSSAHSLALAYGTVPDYKIAASPASKFARLHEVSDEQRQGAAAVQDESVPKDEIKERVEQDGEEREKGNGNELSVAIPSQDGELDQESQNQESELRPQHSRILSWRVLGRHDFSMVVRCRDLVKMDLLSKSDPVVEVFCRDPITGDFDFLDRTEVIQNDHDPDFAKRFTITYDPTLVPPQELRFDVYDADYEVLRVQDRMGSVEVRVCDIIAERDSEHLLVHRENPTRLAGSNARILLTVLPIGARELRTAHKAALSSIEVRKNKLYHMPKSVLTGTSELIHRRHLRQRIDTALAGAGQKLLLPEESLLYYTELKSGSSDSHPGFKDAIAISDQRLFVAEGPVLKQWPRTDVKVSYQDRGAPSKQCKLVIGGDDPYIVEAVGQEVAKFLVRVLVSVPQSRTNSSEDDTEAKQEGKREGGSAGDRVIVVVDEHPIGGLIIFKGRVHFAPGVWVGVALDRPLGDSNGTVDGISYFACPVNFGVFVAPEQVTVVETEESFAVEPKSPMSPKQKMEEAVKDPSTLAIAIMVDVLNAEAGSDPDLLIRVVEELGDGHYWHPLLLLPILRKLLNALLAVTISSSKNWVNDYASPRWESVFRMLQHLRTLLVYRPNEADATQANLHTPEMHWLLHTPSERLLARNGKGLSVVDLPMASTVMELLAKMKLDQISPSLIVDEEERQLATKIKERGLRLQTSWTSALGSLQRQNSAMIQKESSIKSQKSETSIHETNELSLKGHKSEGSIRL